MTEQINRREILAGLGVAGLAGALAPLPAWAESFPSKPVTLVVPFSAGGGGDFAVRLVGTALAKNLGVPVNVENKPGGEGVIGATAVARAKPDGYTVLFATPTSMNYAPAIHRTRPPYDPTKDFRAVSTFASFVFTLCVNAELPVTTLAEFVAYAKENPGDVSYGTGDATSIIAFEQFARAAGIELLHIPYNGTAEAEADLVANRIQCMFLSTSGVKKLGDAIRPLAALYPERTEIVPDVPTFKELGYGAVDLLPWSGFFTTGGAPDEAVNGMSAALQQVLAEPELVAKFAEFGNVVEGSAPEVLDQVLAEQLQVWRDMVDAAGIATD
ncbi:Bug family tripartite tricarboxylate transporter substrate binding protein [Paracoccus sp. (in: a-proteobacteria)]|uniref:Bug family tripartite tricarboxylate transporter substrate binding protein n=1 Tax=Paracoccus sp. TaxID=267 RepID=UPI003A844D23